MPILTTPNASPRIDALDASRGFAILTMVLSGVVPYRGLPAWMYHAQLPPPDRAFSPDLPGLTWVDLVFPLFIFCLGAAIPLSLGRKLSQGETLGKLVAGIAKRTFFLGSFAIVLHHLRPHQIEADPSASTWLLALGGFFLLFGMFSTMPKNWRSGLVKCIRYGCWAVAALLLWQIDYPEDTGFSLYRSDIILLVLTNVYFFTSLLWLLGRQRQSLWLIALALLLAFRLSHNASGWTAGVWDFSPAPWLYRFYYLQYLFIAIPGLWAGELLWRYAGSWQAQAANRSKPNDLALVVAVIALAITVLVGLQERWVGGSMLLSGIVLVLVYVFCLRHKEHPLPKILFWHGAALLLIGYALEPYEGGIKKDPATLSYYFVTAGLAFFMLMAFLLVAQFCAHQKWWEILVGNGKNPMIAYVGFANLLWPILALSGMEEVLGQWTAQPWLGFVRAVVYTAMLAYLVAWFSWRKLFWKT